MNPCQFITGIFVQHTCNKSAINQCAECGTAICLEHSTPQAEGFFCFKCAPMQEPEAGEDTEIDDCVSNSNSFGAWYWYTRSEFHHSGAGDDSSYFDTSDYQSFDSESGSDGIESTYGDDDDDFFDS